MGFMVSLHPGPADAHRRVESCPYLVLQYLLRQPSVALSMEVAYHKLLPLPQHVERVEILCVPVAPGQAALVRLLPLLLCHATTPPSYRKLPYAHPSTYGALPFRTSGIGSSLGGCSWVSLYNSNACSLLLGLPSVLQPFRLGAALRPLVSLSLPLSFPSPQAESDA